MPTLPRKPLRRSRYRRKGKRLLIMKPIRLWAGVHNIGILKDPDRSSLCLLNEGGRMVRYSSIGWLCLIAAFGLALSVLPSKPSEAQGTDMEGSCFGAYDTESIKGFDENKITNDP